MSQAKLLQYFEEELAFLASAGPRFAQLHPERAGLVSLDNVTSRDPDVERLVQAFAFLAGQVRAELHDQLPQLSHTLIDLIWPHYLRPVPSTCTVEIKPDLNQLQSIQKIAKGRGFVESTPITSPETGRDFRCRFRTGADLELQPIKLTSAEVVRQPTRSELVVRLELGPNADPANDWRRLRIHLAGDPIVALDARYWLLEKVDRSAIYAEIEPPKESKRRVGVGSLEPVGLLASENLLPASRLSFPGFRLVQEYFLAKHKFLYVDVTGLESCGSMPGGTRLSIHLPLLDHPPERVRFSAETLRLHCVPVVNLFRSSAVPIRYDGRQPDYELLADHDTQAFAIHEILRVCGQPTGATQVRDYSSFLEFKQSADASETTYHATIQAGVDGRPSWRLALFRPDAIVPPQVLSIDLECSNGELASALLPGEIRYRGEGMPDLVEVRSLTQPERLYQPPIESASPWRFVSHMSMNYLTLEDKDALAGALKLYDWTPGYVNWRRLQGMRTLSSRSGCTVVEGIPLRGRDLDLDMDPTYFANAGDAYLFGEVLSHFLALYAHLNSYTRLTCRWTSGERFRWPAMNGRQQPV